MNFDKIVITKDYLPSKKVEISFSGEHLLIFARNGMGKTSIAREIFENKDIETRENQDESIFYLKDSSINLEYEKDSIYVFGYDFYINFNVSGITPVIESNNLLEDLQYEQRELNTKIGRLARRLARYGGSNQYPNDTIARRLYDFGITSAKFDSKRKETFVERGELGFLKQLIESDLYKKMSSYYDKESEGFDFEKFKEETVWKSDRQLGTIKELSQFRSFFQLKEKIEEIDKDLRVLSERFQLAVEEKRQVTEEYLNRINQQAARIFFDNERIVFTKSKDNLYEVKSRGSVLKNLQALSTAEQNIINLIYFFLKVHAEIELDSDKNVLIVLDDPISSTDFENKIGIYSYLREQIRILSDLKNINLTCLVLTHDEEVFYHFDKMFDDLGQKNIKRLELSNNKKLVEISKEVNFYSRQIADLYLFALGYKEELASYVGNIMRKVLEGYSTFNYAIGMDKLPKFEGLKNRLSDEDREVFENYLYRLVLNSESHKTDNSKLSNPMPGRDYFSIIEKRNTAKIILCLLYRLDNLYVERHLEDFIDANSEIANLKESINRLQSEIQKKKSKIEDKKRAIPKLTGERLSKQQIDIVTLDKERDRLQSELLELKDNMFNVFSNETWKQELATTIKLWLSQRG